MASMDEKLFYEAVEYVIDGRTDRLRDLLDRFPELVKARSPRKHQATLLHYVAANGVEDELQRTPPNAPEVARLLLKRGAEADALAETYGGGSHQTPLCLLVSSVHPHRAGVQAELVHALVDGGAQAGGVEDDGMPLWHALTFGYTDAALALAERGAPVRDIVAAAGLGDMALLRKRWEEYSVGKEARGPHEMTIEAPAGPPIDTPFTRPASTEEVYSHYFLDKAFAYACANSQLQAAAFLLDKGANVDAQVKLLARATPLHRAVADDNPQVADFLVEHGAGLESRDRTYNATPMDWALHMGRKRMEEFLERKLQWAGR